MIVLAYAGAFALVAWGVDKLAETINRSIHTYYYIRSIQ